METSLKETPIPHIPNLFIDMSFRYRKVLLFKIADKFMSISISPFRLRIQNPGQALSLKRKVCIGHDARLLKLSNPAGPKFIQETPKLHVQSCQTAICWQRERACWPVTAIFAHIFDGRISKLPDGNLVLLWKTNNFKSVNHLWMGHYHPFSMHVLNYQTYQTGTKIQWQSISASFKRCANDKKSAMHPSSRGAGLNAVLGSEYPLCCGTAERSPRDFWKIFAVCIQKMIQDDPTISIYRIQYNII